MGTGRKGTGARETAASETAESGGEEFAATAMQPEGPPAWRHGDAKVDIRMHLAGREGAGEKQLQHSPRALFWSELPARGKVSCTSRSGLAFPHPQRRLGMALFNLPPWSPSENPANTNPAPTHVVVAESGPLLLSRQLPNGVKTQNAVKTSNLWSTPSE